MTVLKLRQLNFYRPRRCWPILKNVAFTTLGVQLASPWGTQPGATSSLPSDPPCIGPPPGHRVACWIWLRCPPAVNLYPSIPHPLTKKIWLSRWPQPRLIAQPTKILLTIQLPTKKSAFASLPHRRLFGRMTVVKKNCAITSRLLIGIVSTMTQPQLWGDVNSQCEDSRRLVPWYGLKNT